MRVLLLLKFDWNMVPGQRYRIEQWTPWLREHGVELQAAGMIGASQQRLLHRSGRPLQKGLMLGWCMARRLLHLLRARKADVVWLYRTAWPIGPALPELMLARSGVPFVYEFDDAIWLPDTTEGNRRWRSLKFSGKTATICRLAAHVVVGNAFLAEYARRHNPHVTVIPTTIDTDHYVPRRDYRSEGPLVIGWSGSVTTLPHLRLLDDVLRRVGRQEPIALHVVGTDSYRLDGVPTRAVAWQAERQVAELQQFDVGVMPLPDDDWSRGKCACKALEYMAVGVPAVVSPVGVNDTIIRDGQNGLTAATDDEWVHKLTALARDARLRERLGRAGRTTVEDVYSVQAQAPRVAELLHEVYARRCR